MNLESPKPKNLRWRGESLKAVCCGILLAGFAASAAPQPPAALEGLLPIVESRDTHIDLDGDGNPEIERHFDGEGFVSESISRHPGDVTENFKVSPDRQTTVRRFDFPGGSWTQETNYYDPSGNWIRREKLYGATRDLALDLERESPEDRKLKVEVFVRQGNGWLLKDVRFKPLTYQGGNSRSAPPPPPPRPVDIRLPVPSWTRSEMRSCPRRAASTEPCTWFEYEPLRTDRLDGLSSLVPLECTGDRGRRLYLSNGFSVDLSTCGRDRQAVNRVIASTQAAFRVLECVAGHNRAAAQKILQYLSRAKPRIRCFENLPAPQVRRACSEAPNPEACENAPAEGIGGYVYPGSHDINLFESDPTTTEGAAERNAAELVHELAHSAGIPCNDSLHNISSHAAYMNRLAPRDRTDDTRFQLRAWRNADPVYGINVLCGGGPPAGTPTEDAFTMEPWLDARGPIPIPGGRQYEPPGNLFEMSCTALRGYQATHQCYSFLPSDRCPDRRTPELTSRLNSTVTEIDPECHRLAEAHRDRFRRAREARESERRFFEETFGNGGI